jgi:hypothetical protein
MIAPATGAICSREFMRARRRGRPEICCSPGRYAEHRRQQTRRHRPARVAMAFCAVCGAPSYRWRRPPELKVPLRAPTRAAEDQRH